MALPKFLLIPWLKEQIDSGRYPGVKWTNEDRTEFCIPWKHALRQGSCSDDLIFQAWAEASQRRKSGTIFGDPSVWKRNFQSALRVRGFKMLANNKNDAESSHMVYRWPEEGAQSSASCEASPVHNSWMKTELSPETIGPLPVSEDRIKKILQGDPNIENSVDVLQQCMDDLHLCQPQIDSVFAGVHQSQYTEQLPVTTEPRTLKTCFKMLVHYQGRKVMEELVTNEAGFRLAYRLEDCLKTDPEIQTVLLPPPEGILEKNQAYLTARILHSLGAGLEVRVIGSNVLSLRHSDCKVFWSACKHEQSGPPRELAKFEPQLIFSLDDFMSDFTGFINKQCNCPPISRLFCLGEKWPDSDLTPWEKKLIMVEVVFDALEKLKLTALEQGASPQSSVAQDMTLQARPPISSRTSYCQDYTPTRCCKSCADISDSSQWQLMEPSVSTETGIPIYKHSSHPGSFECAVSGLRWVCAVDVTLQYHLNDPYVFAAELAILQYTPISCLMNIKILSGELLEVHLPHYACLGGSDSSLSDAVKVLHAIGGGLNLETCELTRFHAKLRNPSFSLMEVLVKVCIPIKTHLEVLLYRTRVRPLTLFVYVMPWNASMMQSVKDNSRQKKFKEIDKPQPDTSLWINSSLGLRTSCNSEITPNKYTLNYVRPNFFEVYMDKPDDCFCMELVSGGQSIWEVAMRREDYVETENLISGMMERGLNEMSHTATGGLDKGRMASMSNTDRLTFFRGDLIKRTSTGILKGLLERLEGHQPSVLHSRETAEILQGKTVLQDQVTYLLDLVLKKGEKACGITLRLLEEMDFYLYEDILQNLFASR